MANDMVIVQNGKALLDLEVSKALADFERQAAAIKAREDEIKAALLREMESKNIIKLETPELTIQYIAPFDRESFDTKKFKAEFPETYDIYAKISRVKGSVRVKVKGD